MDKSPGDLGCDVDGEVLDSQAAAGSACESSSAPVAIGSSQTSSTGRKLEGDCEAFSRPIDCVSKSGGTGSGVREGVGVASEESGRSGASASPSESTVGCESGWVVTGSSGSDAGGEDRGTGNSATGISEVSVREADASEELVKRACASSSLESTSDCKSGGTAGGSNGPDVGDEDRRTSSSTADIFASPPVMPSLSVPSI